MSRLLSIRPLADRRPLAWGRTACARHAAGLATCTGGRGDGRARARHNRLARTRSRALAAVGRRDLSDMPGAAAAGGLRAAAARGYRTGGARRRACRAAGERALGEGGARRGRGAPLGHTCVVCPQPAGAADTAADGGMGPAGAANRGGACRMALGAAPIELAAPHGGCCHAAAAPRTGGGPPPQPAPPPQPPPVLRPPA